VTKPWTYREVVRHRTSGNQAAVIRESFSAISSVVELRQPKLGVSFWSLYFDRSQKILVNVWSTVLRKCTRHGLRDGRSAAAVIVRLSFYGKLMAALGRQLTAV
jgi:hypothetical protein